jgi:phage gpG-like protein
MINFQFGLSWQYGEKKGSFALLHRPFREGIENWGPAFSVIAEDVLEPYVRRAFESEGSSEGEHWQELAPSTLRGRPNTPILQITGFLMRSFQRGGADHIEEISARRLVWGSASPLALFHEFGTGGKVNFKRAGARYTVAKTKKGRERFEQSSGGSGGIPARPMMIWSPFLAQEITHKMMGRIVQVARQVGYKVGGRQFEALSPVEARHIGEILLGNA